MRNPYNDSNYLYFSKDTDKECAMHSKSDNMEIMAYDDANKVIEELFESLHPRYQIRF